MPTPAASLPASTLAAKTFALAQPQPRPTVSSHTLAVSSASAFQIKADVSTDKVALAEQGVTALIVLIGAWITVRSNRIHAEKMKESTDAQRAGERAQVQAEHIAVGRTRSMMADSQPRWSWRCN